MSDHNYPDHFYADALSKVRAVTNKPTGAYQAPAEIPAAERKLRTALAYVNHARDLITEALAIQPLGGMRTDQPEGCNPGAVREAKIAYDMASERRVRPECAGGCPPLTVCDTCQGVGGLDHPARIGDVPHERVPKWSPEWAKDLSDYGTAITRYAYRDGELATEHVPLDSVRLHPMNAEAIRDHDERLSGAEDRL